MSILFFHQQYFTLQCVGFITFIKEVMFSPLSFDWLVSWLVDLLVVG